MRRNIIIALLVILFLTLAACAQEEAPLPTTAPIPADEATQEATAAEAPTPVPLRRATLPPTWTPAVSPTEVPQEVQEAQTGSFEPQFVPPTALEVCAAFGEDVERNPRTFKLGESVQVFWTPVAGAVQYSIMLVDQTGVLKVDYTAETSYTFDASLFAAGRLYGWEAYPIDTLGRQMCLSRGAELSPE